MESMYSTEPLPPADWAFGIVANVLDCDLVIKLFDLQLRYYIHFLTNALEKGMHPLIFLQARG